MSWPIFFCWEICISKGRQHIFNIIAHKTKSIWSGQGIYGANRNGIPRIFTTRPIGNCVTGLPDSITAVLRACRWVSIQLETSVMRGLAGIKIDNDGQTLFVDQSTRAHRKCLVEYPCSMHTNILGRT